MKNLFSCCLLAALLCFAFFVGAQPTNKINNNVTIPSANAGSLGKYGDIPVGNFTGTPSINIPIYTLQEGPISVPISMSYHASGLKVNELASWVGLGWSLNAGGMISRSVLSVKDDDPNGWLNKALPDPANLLHNDWDREPDIFSYSFGGQSGKFFIGKDKKAHCTEKNDLKIEFTPSNNGTILTGFDQFVIRTSDGLIYTFSEYETSTFDVGTTIRSGWYLTSIKEPSYDPLNGYNTFIINFTYVDENYSYRTLPSMSRQDYNLDCGSANCASASNPSVVCSAPGGSFNSGYHYNTINGKRLSKISSLRTDIEFIANTANRKDFTGDALNAKALDKITIKEGKPTIAFQKSWKLTQSYYYDSRLATFQSNGFTALSATIDNTHRYRLKLDKITETGDAVAGSVAISIPDYVFTYDGESATAPDGSLTTFFPSTLSKQYDHWGFYNGKHIASTANVSNSDTNEGAMNFINIPSTTVATAGNSTYTYPGIADRNSREKDANYMGMQQGVLNKITYPTGGNTMFEFEGNKVYGSLTEPTYTNLYTELKSCTTNDLACCSTNPAFTIGNYGLISNDAISLLELKMSLTKGVCTGNTSYELQIVRINDNLTMVQSFTFWYVIDPNNTTTVVTKTLNEMGNFTPGIYTFKIRAINGIASLALKMPNFTNTNLLVGGLRVKKITHNDGISNTNVKTYEYKDENTPANSSGRLYARPVYGFSKNKNFNPSNTTCGCTGSCSMYYFKISDTPIASLGSYQGYHVGYNRVIEKNMDVTGTTMVSGQTIYDYFVEIAPKLTVPIPFPPYPPTVKHGNANKTSVYSNDNLVTPLSLTENYPDSKINTIPESYGTAFTEFKMSDCGTGTIYINEYLLQVGRYRLASTTTTMDQVASTQTFGYDLDYRYPYPNKVITHNSDGIEHRQEISYVHDLNTQNYNPRDKLLFYNMIAQPIVTKKFVNNVMVDGDEFSYGRYLPDGTWTNNTTLTNIFPRKWRTYRNKVTWDANNTLQTTTISADKQIDEIATYYSNGLPKTYQYLTWPLETYTYNATGLLTTKTFKDYTATYDYHTGTGLLKYLKNPDQQETWYDYDALMRESKIWQRPTTAGTKTDVNMNVKTTYTYTYASGAIKNSIKTSTSYNGSLQEQVQYMDGLGRVIQTVAVKQSPIDIENLVFNDLVTTVGYDDQGRVSKSYLPFQSTLQTGAYVALPSGQLYNLTNYEPSPLARAIKTTPPDWYTTTTSFGTNTATDNVRRNLTLTTDYYPAGKLFKTVTQEPGNTSTTSNGVSDGNDKITTFTDLLGRTVLVRKTGTAFGTATFGGVTLGGTAFTIAETYYSYDDKSRLKYVLPPMSPGLSITPSNILVYSYLYDWNDQIIQKKIPDAGTINYKYNVRQQLVLQQDPNLLVANKWMCTKYDDYGRQTKFGLKATIPTVIDLTLEPDPTDLYTVTEYGTLVAGLPTVEIDKVKTQKTKILDGTTNWLSSTYEYDKHGRLTKTFGNSHINLTAVSDGDVVTKLYNWSDKLTSNFRKFKATASTELIVSSGYAYDAWDRLAINSSRIGTITSDLVLPSTLRYNFRGEVVKKNIGSYQFNPAKFLQSVDYTYNAQGWLTNINGSDLTGANLPATPVGFAACPPTTNAQAMPNLGTPDALPDNNDLFYMSLLYNKEGDIAENTWRVRGREKQRYSLSYDFAGRLINANYYNLDNNGAQSNVGAWNEKIAYDQRGNIMGLARYGKYKAAPTDNCWSQGEIDHLTFAYDGNTSGTNRLLSIFEEAPTASKSYGWNNSTGVANNIFYEYDANGNMKKDPHKGMSVTYNFLNLPKKIEFGTAGNLKVIDILYDGSGRKLSKTVTSAGFIQYTEDYCNGIEYRSTPALGRRLESVAHAEGRVYNTNVNSTTANAPEVLRYEYNLRDHLGNTRLTFTDKNNNKAVDVTNTATNEILQENHYYPFGLAMQGPWMDDALALDNAYQYNGKELNSDFGLGWNDYGARWYDASVGRWWCPDKMADDPMQIDKSPYAYAWNSPVKNIDPDGNFPIETLWDAANVIYDAGKIVYGAATGNKAMVASGAKDLVADGAAMLIPYVPAGASKLYKGAEVAVDAAKGLDKAADVAKTTDKALDSQKTYQTYTKTNAKTGEVYSGKTSGKGTPEQNVADRDQSHHMNKEGFGPAKLDKSSKKSDPIRGREQQNIDKNGGSKSSGGTSGNQNRGVSPKNKKAGQYDKAANKEFGKL
jgi:RHS repeat-associated protein